MRVKGFRVDQLVMLGLLTIVIVLAYVGLDDQARWFSGAAAGWIVGTAFAAWDEQKRWAEVRRTAEEMREIIRGKRGIDA
jgi:hypothetical protein